MRISFFTAAIILTVVGGCLATSQIGDVIIVDGAAFELLSNPLEQLYKSHARPKFFYMPGDEEISTNWRGYVAYWQLRDNHLFLIAIDAYVNKQKASLQTLFGNQVIDGRVRADWFSGELRIPEGETLQSVNMGYGSVYERDVIYMIKGGAVVDRKVIDNTKKPLPTEDQQAERELQKLKQWQDETKH